MSNDVKVNICSKNFEQKSLYEVNIIGKQFSARLVVNIPNNLIENVSKITNFSLDDTWYVGSFRVNKENKMDFFEIIGTASKVGMYAFLIKASNLEQNVIKERYLSNEDSTKQALILFRNNGNISETNFTSFFLDMTPKDFFKPIEKQFNDIALIMYPKFSGIFSNINSTSDCSCKGYFGSATCCTAPSNGCPAKKCDVAGYCLCGSDFGCKKSDKCWEYTDCNCGL